MKVIYGSQSIEEPLVATFGNFDGVHTAHMEILNQVIHIARDKSYKSVVITFAPHPRKVLHPNIEDFQLFSLSQKISYIGNCGIDVLIVIQFTKDFANIAAEQFITEFLLTKYNIKRFVVGSKCSFGKGGLGNVEIIQSLSRKHNFTVDIVSAIEDTNLVYSSTHVRDLLRIGDVSGVSAVMGREYEIEGVVIHGEKRGRAIGFPTINISLQGKIKPRFGVYSAKMTRKGKVFFGVVNIGLRPTFESIKEVLLEMFVFDFSTEIYGEKVHIFLLDFIREEQKFSNIEELKSQITKDIDYCQQFHPNDLGSH